ncbi:MAG: thioesterase family protein [Solirubrobacteraceae bacterium]
MALDSLFTVAHDLFVPGPLAGGPWDPDALHGGAPAALIVTELERTLPERLVVGRLSVELLRPVPSAPLALTVEPIRPGRRVHELAVELRHEGELVCRASALAVQHVPARAVGAARTNLAQMPPSRALPRPDSPEAQPFDVDGPLSPAFASAVEMRWLTQPWRRGPAQVWMRMRVGVLPDARASPLATLAAVADFGNGVSAELRFDRFIFINADLSIHLWRAPRDEWIGLDARTLLFEDGAGVAESILHDVHGPVGRAFQTLVVEQR